MRWKAIVLALALSVSGFGLTGCHGKGSTAAMKKEQHPVRGIVRSVDASSGAVMLQHEAIPGFMEAMTMEYKLEDASVASELHAGDKITATLTMDRDAAGPLNMRLREVVVIAQARPDYKPTVQYHLPQPGESVPDFALLNQSGKTVHLKQLRGQVVLMTFIYTRCPLAEFCPRMSRQFAEIDKALQSDPALYAKTHLLSVSFDPTYDTPAVLRSYGGAYTGQYTRETFGHWEFAAPPVAALPRMEQFFDVGVTPGDGPASLQHSLSTCIIGKDGKVVAFYPTNDWTVADVLAKVKAAV